MRMCRLGASSPSTAVVQSAGAISSSVPTSTTGLRQEVSTARKRWRSRLLQCGHRASGRAPGPLAEATRRPLPARRAEAPGNVQASVHASMIHVTRVPAVTPRRARPCAITPRRPGRRRLGRGGCAEVVVDHLVAPAGRVAEHGGHRGLGARVARQLVAALALHQRDGVAHPAHHAPRAHQHVGVVGRRAAPASAAAPRASRVRGVRSPGTAPACRICSSCTVHSMSASPPRPSLRWVFGSAPRGSRSRSMRALTRRTSATSASVTPRRPGSATGRSAR